MKRNVVGASRLASGPLVCATVAGKTNAVFMHDRAASGGWRPLVEWRGRPLTACCACGDTVVAAGTDDVTYVVDGTRVSQVTLPEDTRTMVYGACALSNDAALLGGAGGLFRVSVRERSAVRVRLSEFGVSRPGRHVHNIVRVGDRMLILGLKNLVVDFRGDSATEPVPRDALGGREFMFGDAVELDGVTWLSAAESLRPLLVRLDTHGVTFHDSPQPGPSVPRLGAVNGELLVGARGLSVGRPGAWRDLPTPGMGVLDAIVSVVRTGVGEEVCAISSDGRSFFTDGRAVHDAAAI